MPTRSASTLNADGSCTVRDNGRGIPTGIHKGEGVSAAEVIMTQLHAGGKFDQNSYKVSGGLHGVGVSVVNALSSKLKLQDLARRQDPRDELHPRRARRAAGRRPATVDGRNGTEVTFLPSTETFTMIEFDYATLEHRLRELAFLNSGVRIVLTDKRGVEPKTETLHVRGRPRRVRPLSRPRQEAADPDADHGHAASATASPSRSRCGGTTATTRTCCCFTNNIPQRDGGTHLAGFRGALTRQVTGYADSQGIVARRRRWR